MIYKELYETNLIIAEIIEESEEAQLFQEFCYYLDRLERMEEGFFDSLKSNIKDKLDFVKALSSEFGLKLSSLIALFKDSKVFKFFQSVGWSFQAIFDLVKKGFSAANIIATEISKYLANTKVGKWTEEKLKELDEWLQKNPRVRKIAGLGVAGLLIYIWLNMTFTGDFAYDFDFSDILMAVVGKFSLAKLFSGTDGIKLLMLFATGMIGLSFPWPGPTSVKFITAVLTGLSKLIKKKLKFV